MSQTLILLGGAGTVLVWLFLVGYGASHLAARRYREAAISLLCAMFISILAIVGVINAPAWAEVIWK